MVARSSAAQSSPPPGILEHHHPGTQSMDASPRSPFLAADANPVNPFLFSFSSSSDLCWILPPSTPGIRTPALHSIAAPCLLLAAAAPHRVRPPSRCPNSSAFPNPCWLTFSQRPPRPSRGRLLTRIRLARCTPSHPSCCCVKIHRPEDARDLSAQQNAALLVQNRQR
ncbi:uncharacterized protein LOC119316621 isoform X1 [Triticum dicoccoides]|uniref:uncharacterized protein LOC119316621 isoform X1 n=1 Tax=Triticum dicoccoides TaxID=85692 RepID=UPI001891E1E2|nr:uncharacterized protein LOC119316621 isoform X1 [Triticum dicoccoides]XP_044402866.1 uncharacterized protein LOC123127285 isoform X1 [Triticum aestivum]